MLFKFRKVKFLLCSFCTFSEETPVHLFSRYLLSQSICSQTQIIFLNYFTIPNILQKSALLGFLE